MTQSRTSPLVDYEREGEIVTLTLNRPEKLNAFNDELVGALSDALHRFDMEDEAQIAILTGRGRAFSAGGNVIAMQQKIDNPDLWDATSAPEAKRIIFRMLECDKPIIARVNGHAVGLGATVALMCDIIIAADTAKIGDPHVSAGLVAGDGGR